MIYTASYIAEIVRSGIQAVPQGQWEAARRAGPAAAAPVLRQIVLPQALRVIIPPMTSQYLNLTKNSSLAVAIGFQDIVSIANTTLNQTGQAIEGIADHHGGLSDHQPVDQPVHELVQRAHRAGGALSHERRPLSPPIPRHAAAARAQPPSAVGRPVGLGARQPVRLVAGPPRSRWCWAT